MHLHNLLTTHSHLNHYTISQVSSANIQEPTGKIPELFFFLLFFIRQPGSTCGWESEKERLVPKVVNWFDHTRLHCMGINLMNDQDAAESLTGLSVGWVLKFTWHYQTFTSCNDFPYSKIWSNLLDITIKESSYIY